MDARAPKPEQARPPRAPFPVVAAMARAPARGDAAFGPRIPVTQVLALDAVEMLTAYDPPARTAMRAMARYVTEFLTSEHRALGRAGAVCPFARQAAAEKLIRITACSSLDEATIVEGVAQLRGELADLSRWPGSGKGPRHRAIVAVFPQLVEPDGARLIERIQKRLKPSFVKGRLMIGQFYPSCAEPGLRNPAFRPLQSPVISLAMRDMTIFDAPFMLDRAEYVDAFVAAFGAPGENMIAKAVRARGRLGHDG
ncbi:hypothetical protein LJR219_004129 [Phenylobacterium sp. LjRoot219]|uniref:DUF6875 domain-containing protein n=1 Tax=Phenylobacterium sp. LjRoot219 TaxID=3342283 RepID=UPI003ECFC147